MDPGGEIYVQALLNRLEEIHNQVMRYVKTAEREDILVFRPLAFDQFNIESLILEETILDCAEYRRFARDTDVSHPNFSGAAFGDRRSTFGLIAAHDEEHGA
jgi:hypothetical protein